MTTTTHTKGPWRVDGRFVRAEARKTKPICEVPEGGMLHEGTDAANAHLIAAGPTGYALIKEAVTARIDDAWLIRAKAYLAQAEGRAS